MNNRLKGIAGLMLAAGLLVGCESDMENAADQVEDTAEEAAEAAKEPFQSPAEEAGEAGGGTLRAENPWWWSGVGLHLGLGH